MRSYVMFRSLGLLAMFFASFQTFAYYDEKEDERCREPKIQEFNLPEYHAAAVKEVPPEAEFSFVVSEWADPKKIKVMGKDKPIPFTVESKETYHKIKGKLPAEYSGKFVRLNVRIPAILGCYSSQGWLLKVAGGTNSEDSSKPASTEPAMPVPAKEVPEKTKVEPAAKPEAAVVQPANESDSNETKAGAPAPEEKQVGTE